MCWRSLSLLPALAAVFTVAALAPSGSWAAQGRAGTAAPRWAPESTLPDMFTVMGKTERFLAGARGGYLLPKSSAAHDLAAAVSYGGAIPERSDSGWILWSTRRHSADERGAVLLSPDGRTVLAAGIIHFDCYGVWRNLPRRSAARCTDSAKPLLSVFLWHTPGASRFANEMSAWADRQEHHRVPFKVVWVGPKGRGD